MAKTMSLMLNFDAEYLTCMAWRFVMHLYLLRCGQLYESEQQNALSMA